MKPIKTSTFNFEEIINSGFLYVDKTAFVWNLVKDGKDEYFLSRPRRFGKSLLVSTLKALFQGRRELFRGLAIDQEDYDWKAYPVIHLDFGNCMAVSVPELRDYLNLRLQDCAAEHGIALAQSAPQERLVELMQTLAKTAQVVVLVDEYDKPILSNIATPQASELLRELKGFYSAIKTYEGLIRFALVTGVSKFAHVSLFSELNNLTDITLHPDYAGMLGFTAAEIREYFADRIPLAAEANGMSPEALTERLLEWYDGYRFSPAETHVCNPVSVSKFFTNCYAFSNYWEDTGTPSFLLELARRQSYDYEAALEQYYDESVFKSYELDRLDVTGLLWQTGYLTIKEIVQGLRGLKYRLGFPDREVNDTFCLRLLEIYGRVSESVGNSTLERLQETICADNLAGFMTHFQAFLACIPYEMHLKYEKYYQTIFYCVFKLLGASIEAESRTNAGRIDAYIKTARTVYIFEFKLNQTSETAVGQILDRRYYERFQGGGQPIVLVGANFDSSKGRLVNWAETTMSSSTLISEDVLH